MQEKASSAKTMASAVSEVLFYCCILIFYQLQILDTVAFIGVRSLFQSQVSEGYLFNIEDSGGGW